MIPGFILIGLAVAMGVTFIGLLTDSDGLATAGVGLLVAGVVLCLAGLGVYLVFGGSISTPLREGACYRAVRHSTTTLIPVSTGKTVILIPSTTSGIDLEEITCP